ncbi:hypothetical protein F3Y22_tig00111582pilonHSYRG01424 [Hibiscus syriacus]|uniref:Major facilitator superfamily (MFS) profile domain-containing protein n=1 Tax=Hibiscus syriacus TaxID=106335 RepID=A0A6A2YDM5_HIBSY|nr:hypothetical protein F3Y22_tig00111582pilonHSYRG01424 [Hibiscus syriacus]
MFLAPTTYHVNQVESLILLDFGACDLMNSIEMARAVGDDKILSLTQRLIGVGGVGSFINRHIHRMLDCSNIISNEGTQLASTMGSIVCTMWIAVGMGAVPWVLMSEIFPINVKGVAGSLVNLEHWFGAWACSYTFNFLMDWSPSGTFFLYSGVCAASVIFVAKVVPETKGSTLEEAIVTAHRGRSPPTIVGGQ